jgi:hypothetical protein
LESVQETNKESPLLTDKILEQGQRDRAATNQRLPERPWRLGAPTAVAKHVGGILGLGGADGQRVLERTILGQVSTLAQLARMDDTDLDRTRVAQPETGQLLVQRRVQLIRQAKASR